MPYEHRESYEHERPAMYEHEHPAVYEHEHSATLAPMESSANPAFHTNRPRKVLIATHAKAGWITWAPHGASDEFLIWMLTYEPLINAIERHAHKDKLEDLRDEFHRQARHRFNVEKLAVCKAEHLLIEEVSYPFEVREHEGCERIVRIPETSHQRKVFI